MKKISTILLIAGFSGFAFAQKDNAFANSYNRSTQDNGPVTAEDGPGSGGADGTDPAPIDDYIPLLALAGVGMAVYFGRKKYVLTK